MTRLDECCDDFREHLLELDEGAPLSTTHSEHLADCDDCTALYASLVEVDAGLAALAPIEAPPELVARALAQIDAVEMAPASAEPARQSAPPTVAAIVGGSLGVVFGGFWKLLAMLFWPLRNLKKHPLLSSGIAVTGAATAAALLSVSMFMAGAPDEAQVAQVSLEDEENAEHLSWGDDGDARGMNQNAAATAPTTPSEDPSDEFLYEAPALTSDRRDQLRGLGYLGGGGDLAGPADGAFGEDLDLTLDGDEDGEGRFLLELDNVLEDAQGRGLEGLPAAEVPRLEGGRDEGRAQNGVSNFEQNAPTSGTEEGEYEQRFASATAARPQGVTTRGGETTSPDVPMAARPGYRNEAERERRGEEPEEATRPSPRQRAPEVSGEGLRTPAADAPSPARTPAVQRQVAGNAGTVGDFRQHANRPASGPASIEQDSWSRDQGGLDHGLVAGNAVDTTTLLPSGQHRVTLARSRAERLFEHRGRISGLSFQEARGHWSNSYVPGDPAARTLHQRLVASGAALGNTGATGLQLAEAARSFAQPFDAPRHSALAVSVQGDHRATEGERRMLVQVGLRGAERRSGTRPAMNVGVVLDLSRPLDGEDEARVRALLQAIGEARELGDRISLTVAGPAGGTVVESGAFRHGQVQVALAQLFDDAERAGTVSALGLDAAVRSALASVGASDDPTAPLGSSFLLVVTPGLTPSRTLERAVHVGAVAGIPTSVVGLGGATLGPLDRLALAGQGRRRTLGDAGEAASIVRDELGAVSQVVARAIRLRIRLAPGTRLVNVLGSRRLDRAATARVRRAERSIDQRLARSLGIEADREQDDDGITIFIPAFYAGDSHVVLLDVVASGPGPVAEVTARYKDLVRLRNGESRGSLRLGRGRRGRGPLERAVLKNYLGHRLSVALGHAAGLLRGGDANAARRTLTEFVELAEGVRLVVPELASDRELAADLALAARYDAALMTLTPPQHAAAADSLWLASRRKTFEPMFSR